MVVKTNTGFSVRVLPSKNTLSLCVADRICALARERQAQGRPLVLGLAAGASPRGVYRALGLRVRTGQLDLARSAVFCLDEYYPIDPTDPRSYARQMTEIVRDLGVPKDMLHIPRGDVPRERIELHCRQYEEDIDLAGGIDFQLLGVGRSGHIGFNEPGSSKESRTRLVRLDERTRRDAADTFGGLDLVPQEAITIGIRNILEAREIALIATGESKAAIVRQLVEEPPNQAAPASFLKTHGCATVYLDEEAAGLLTPNRGTIGELAHAL